jgi:SAM-dependent methyltransferase
MKDFWDERYAQAEYAYGTEPNAFFAATLAGLPPGRLLLPAEGEGRNAVHAAALGWSVDAFDFSRSGQHKALRLATDRGVSIRYELATYESFPIEERAYDMVALVFAHIHEAHRRSVHQRLAAGLRPGGILVLEAFTKEQLARGTGGPRSLELLYDPDELRTDFAGLAIQSVETLDTELEEGPYHRGVASVVRLVAERPA